MPRRRDVRGVVLILAAAFLGMAAASVQAASASRIALRVERMGADAVRLRATVLGPKGSLAPDVPLTVRGRTTFGWLVLAQATTDKQGQAVIDIPWGPVAEDLAVEAEGDVPLTASIRLGRRPSIPHLVRPGAGVLAPLAHQPGLISPRPAPFLVALLALVVGGVWVTYGYVVSLLLGVRRDRARDPSDWPV